MHELVAEVLHRTYAFDAFAPPRERGPTRRVAVVGAGIAGLTAAFELLQRGHDVALYEAEERAGGRILTVRFADGLHGELGAMRIPSHHGCVMHYVRSFGLPTRTFVHHNPRAYYHLRGNRVRIGSSPTQWPEAWELREDPAELEARAVEACRAGWRVELLETLLRGGLTPELEALDAATYYELVSRGLEPSVAALVGAASGAAHYDRVSGLSGLVDALNWGSGPFFELRDGMDALVQAFVHRLGDALRLGTPIQAMAVRDEHVELCLGGRGRSLQAFDFVVCCVPAPALRRIELTPDLSGDQRRAVTDLRYSPSAKSLVVAPRCWERDEGIAGGVSVTDLPIHQCLYPSDNARIEPGGEILVASPERARGLGVLTAGYRWERHAVAFDRLAVAERDAVTLRALGQLHPGLPAQVQACVHRSWPEAYAFFGPGERRGFYDALRRPFPRERPRVFFAGEHISPCHASIQGAIQTGLEAVASLEAEARRRVAPLTVSAPQEGARTMAEPRESVDDRVERWRARGFRVEEWTMDPGGSWADDGHDGDEFILLLEGRIEVRLDERARASVVTPAVGEHVFIPAGMQHTVANVAGTPSRIYWAHDYPYDGANEGARGPE